MGARLLLTRGNEEAIKWEILLLDLKRELRSLGVVGRCIKVFLFKFYVLKCLKF